MMSVKRMIDLYLSYCLSDDTWNMLWQMCFHGLISYENWNKFSAECHSWTVDGELNAIIDGETGKVVYLYDEMGDFHKVS